MMAYLSFHILIEYSLSSQLKNILWTQIAHLTMKFLNINGFYILWQNKIGFEWLSC